MARKVLTDDNWAQLAPLFPRKGPQAKRRLRLAGSLWIHRTGAPWRDLPAAFGKPSMVQSCFYRWDDSGLWARLWQRLRDTLGADHEAVYIDSTSVPAHRHSAGAAPAQSEQALVPRAAGAAPRSTPCLVEVLMVLRSHPNAECIPLPVKDSGRQLDASWEELVASVDIRVIVGTNFISQHEHDRQWQLAHRTLAHKLRCYVGAVPDEFVRALQADVKKSSPGSGGEIA